MKKRKFVNSKKTNSIKDLEKKFDEKKELLTQITNLKKENHQKAKEIIELRENIVILDHQLEKIQAETEVSDEYLIAVIELEKLKKLQEERSFSIDEIRSFDTLVKIKRLCSGQSTLNQSDIKERTKKTPDSSLLKIISSKK